MLFDSEERVKRRLAREVRKLMEILRKKKKVHEVFTVDETTITFRDVTND